LPRDLATGEGGIGAIALAPAVVAADTAVRDAPVTMPYDVLGFEFVPALALRNAWKSGASRSRHGPEMIKVHATPVAAETLDQGRRQEGTATRFEQAPTRGRDRAAGGP